MLKPLYIKKHGAQIEIARLLGTSEHTVSYAINGKIDTPMARKVRTIAKRNYGAVEIDVAPSK